MSDRTRKQRTKKYYQETGKNNDSAIVDNKHFN